MSANVPGLPELAAAVRAAARDPILVVTGAGVSLASGVPTFRGNDPGAVWKRDVTELGTHRFWVEDPAGSWAWYLSRFDRLRDARPNPGHLALAALERWQVAQGGGFLLVTQNIDTLHERAGSERLIKVHGTSDRYRCDREGCACGPPTGSVPAAEVDLEPFRAAPTLENVPRCPACGGPLRLHVLWFDEYYTQHADYRFEEVVRAARCEARLVIFVGTSFSVGVTALVLEGALARDVPVFNVDPNPCLDDDSIRNVVAPSEVALVAMCDDLSSPSTS
ncbi:MAG: RNA polymerase subunit sigma [Proteobacteria bacterium]|jgi:NAD-dependent deacetylase|nr:RNA polymerase subunit sigma [Pseudomonadota bacterium]